MTPRPGGDHHQVEGLPPGREGGFNLGPFPPLRRVKGATPYRLSSVIESFACGNWSRKRAFDHPGGAHRLGGRAPCVDTTVDPDLEPTRPNLAPRACA